MPPDTEDARPRWASTTRSSSRPGVMLAGEGLQPSSKGARVRSRRQAHRDRRPVRRDQGADRRLLAVAGARMDEAIEWVKRCPNPTGDESASRSARSSRPRTSATSSRPSCASRSERLRAARLEASRVVAARLATTHRAIDAVWRIESPKLIAGLTRIVRDVGLAEELAQDALVAALEQWPESGVPDNPGAWLMATAKHRAIDQLRRSATLERKHEELGARARDWSSSAAGRDLDAALDDDVGDDLLRLIFIACHPVLSTEARAALTLRLLGGLTTDEIARAFLVPEPTVAQRIVRAKRTLADGARAVRGAAARRARRPAGVGARGDLPRLQRGLRRHRRRRLDAPRALRGRAAARAHPGRARARRARGARPRGADGDPGVALARARRPGGRAGAAARPGPRALGPRC